MGKINVLKDARDFVIVRQPRGGNYVYAVKPSLDIMRQFYEQSISNPDDKNIRAFRGCWKFDESHPLIYKRGIQGSNTFLALRFDKLALRPHGLWVPGLLEAKSFRDRGKLEDKVGVYRDYGIIVGDNIARPNEQIAEILIPQAKKLRLEFPLIVPFRALDYINDKNNIMGIKLSLLNLKGIIYGKEAQHEIDSLDYHCITPSIKRLIRDRFGDFDPNRTDLEISIDTGRIDWICGEAHY